MEYVESLSDDELFQQLKNFGLSVGPVVDSTRRVYQRKLARLLNPALDENRPSSASLPNTSSSRDYPDSFSSVSYRQPSWQSGSLGRVSDEVPAVRRVGSSPVPVVVKAVLVGVLLLLAFLVYYNMEDASSNPIPDL